MIVQHSFIRNAEEDAEEMHPVGRNLERRSSVAVFSTSSFFFFFFFKATFYSYFIYLFIYFWLCWVFGSCEGFLRLRQVGATLHCGVGTALHRGARAFHHRGPSRCGAQAPDAQAQ